MNSHLRTVRLLVSALALPFLLVLLVFLASDAAAAPNHPDPALPARRTALGAVPLTAATGASGPLADYRLNSTLTLTDYVAIKRLAVYAVQDFPDGVPTPFTLEFPANLSFESFSVETTPADRCSRPTSYQVVCPDGETITHLRVSFQLAGIPAMQATNLRVQAAWGLQADFPVDWTGDLFYRAPLQWLQSDHAPVLNVPPNPGTGALGHLRWVNNGLNHFVVETLLHDPGVSAAFLPTGLMFAAR